MKPFWFRQIFRPVSVALAACAAGLVAGADMVLPEAPAETLLVPPAFDLPLREGERLVPTADGACSVVVFAPHEERYERVAAYWSRANWVGECRFGLAHGDGKIASVPGNWTVDASMLYGVEVGRSEVAVIPAGQEDGFAASVPADTLNYFSGTAFSDTGSVRYAIHLEREPQGELELGDLGSDWYGSDYLERYAFDKSGRETAMSVSVWNVDTYCGLGLPDEFERFEKEVKKACKKTGDKLVLIRREGFVADLWSERPITWLKSCPVNRASRASDCGQLVSAALGKEAEELETLLTEGDAAARRAAEQEIIDRYGPLEAALDEELLSFSAEPMALDDQPAD
jgi:hypothetical protein